MLIKVQFGLESEIIRTTIQINDRVPSIMYILFIFYLALNFVQKTLDYSVSIPPIFSTLCLNATASSPIAAIRVMPMMLSKKRMKVLRFLVML